ncbi:hypothetical protein KAR91_06075 [Candidatus Pacearchaeota archaeon]|nr:hypothetical protein [Candidatus Pacearchaeota archaeon]
MKELRGVGGLPNNLILLSQIFIFAIAIINIITQFIQGSIQEKFLTDALPFLIIPIILHFLKKKIFIIFIYTFIGTVSIFTSNIGEFSGIVFIIFAVYIAKNLKFELILLFITAFSIVFSTYFDNQTTFQSFLMFSVYSYIYLIYFFTIRADQKKLDNPILSIPKVYLLPHEKQLIQLLFTGHTRQEIYVIMNKGKNAINRYQNSIRGKFHAKTFEECLLKVGKSVMINGISTDADK